METADAEYNGPESRLYKIYFRDLSRYNEPSRVDDGFLIDSLSTTCMKR